MRCGVTVAYNMLHPFDKLYLTTLQRQERPSFGGALVVFSIARKFFRPMEKIRT